MKSHIELLERQNELYTELISHIIKNVKPMSFVEFITDRKRVHLHVINEGLNKNNTFDYLKTEDNVWLIDAGIINERRFFYLVSIKNNEIQFSLILVPNMYNDMTISKDFTLEHLNNIMFDIANAKGMSALSNYVSYKTQDLNLDFIVVKKIFNTIYKIMRNYISENDIEYFYFIADKKEKSKTSFYEFLFDLLDREDNLSGSVVSDNSDDFSDYENVITNYKKGFVYYIVDVK